MKRSAHKKPGDGATRVTKSNAQSNVVENVASLHLLNFMDCC